MAAIKSLGRCRKGIVGIEAAIVLIAFVIIAAALAYVIVNTGFYASQKSKETITRGIGEAASSMQLDGSVIAYANKSGSNVAFLILPLKISVGKEGVDVSNKSIAVTVRVGSMYMPNIYNGTTSINTKNITESLESIAKKARGAPAAYMAIIGDGDEILESSEKGFLVVYLGSSGAKEYDKLKVEVRAPLGASLIVEREIPAGLEPGQFIDLG